MSFLSEFLAVANISQRFYDIGFEKAVSVRHTLELQTLILPLLILAIRKYRLHRDPLKIWTIDNQCTGPLRVRQ